MAHQVLGKFLEELLDQVTDSNKAEVSFARLIQNLLRVLLEFSPDVYSQFGGPAQPNPRY